MAHQCPNCGLQCTCHGDIDDIVFEDSAAKDVCDHCLDEGEYPIGDDDIWTDEKENAEIEAEILRDAQEARI